MKSRPTPTPSRHIMQRFVARDPQVQAWIQRLLGDPEATIDDADEETIAFVSTEVLRRRDPGAELGLFQRKLADTCPILALPEFEGPRTDLPTILAQPEIQELWNAWTGPQPLRGKPPAYSGAKAALCLLGMGRQATKLEHAVDRLADSKTLGPLFADLDGCRNLDTPSYASTCRLVRKLSENDRCRWTAITANIELLRWLRENHPRGREIGKTLLIDGSAIPAWVPQRAAGGDRDDPGWQQREEQLRKRAPEAGFRAYTHTRDGKQDLHPRDKVAVRTNVKSWRGYYLVLIVDQATGLPVVWQVIDAAFQETSALVPLLSDLHRLWPDIGAEYIVGDSIWNTNENCRLCAVNYGINAVFRMKPSELATKERSKYQMLDKGAHRDGTINAITYDGRLVCKKHGKPLAFVGVEQPTRGLLPPGQETPESAHRIRGLCTHSTPHAPHPCGKPGIQMQTDWHRLAALPHHHRGNPEKHALRLALLTRLNQVEACFSLLKRSGLGSDGPGRPRFTDRASYEAVISLALTGITGLTVADQRQQLADERVAA